MLVTKDDCLSPYLELTEDPEQITSTSAAKSPPQRMVSREMSPVIKEGDSMPYVARSEEAVQLKYEARLKLDLLWALTQDNLASQMMYS